MFRHEERLAVEVTKLLAEEIRSRVVSLSSAIRKGIAG
jgi:hypothetical protein